MVAMEPLFKWVGSKRWIAQQLAPDIKEQLTGTYYEPFIGGGSVFFAVMPERAQLSDSIQALVSTYRHIQLNHREVWTWMGAAAGQGDSKPNYLLRRSRFNQLITSGQYTNEMAGLFIYLLSAGFNGLWRQNKEGEFNVPYGDHSHLKLPTISDFIFASKILSGNVILNYIENPQTTLQLIQRAGPGDVIFSDPPYYDLYNEYDGLFSASREYHESIAAELWKAAIRGASVYAMNVECPETRRWYAWAECKTFDRSQVIAGTTEGRKEWTQLLAVAIP
jgi:DNA adenine methylase